MWFARFANSPCGSGADISCPPPTPNTSPTRPSWLVIGRAAHRVSAEQALAQMQNPLWTSKAIDTFSPCGSALVTLEEIGDLADLKLSTLIDGETVQQQTYLRPGRAGAVAIARHGAGATQSTIVMPASSAYSMASSSPRPTASGSGDSTTRSSVRCTRSPNSSSA